MSQYAVTAITLGLISLVVMTLSNLIISLLRPLMFELIRLPLQIMVIASLVTAADLLLQAFYFELHQRIGLFVALIVTNCAILGRAELFARRSSAPKALIDGWFMGLGFFWVIAVMGMARKSWVKELFLRRPAGLPVLIFLMPASRSPPSPFSWCHLRPALFSFLL